MNNIHDNEDESIGWKYLKIYIINHNWINSFEETNLTKKISKIACLAEFLI